MDQESSTIVNEKKAARYDNNVKAIIAAFFGALSILFLLIMVFIAMVFGFISIIFGIISLVELRTSEQNGKGMAILGIICGSITLGLPLLVIVYAAIVL